GRGGGRRAGRGSGHGAILSAGPGPAGPRRPTCGQRRPCGQRGATGGRFPL
ncbi:MAG: hypothetical protein AVDCRST_MAG57-968, partial [uncultured Blastococcus sp.]